MNNAAQGALASITIYHNPACGTSRTVLGLIRSSGEEPVVIEYLRTPPSRAELTGLIEARFSRLTRAGVEALLDSADIANAPMNTMGDVWAHPQFAARDRWRQIATPAGPIAALLPPATLSGAPAVMGDVPVVGSHNQAILAELGYDAEAIARLKTEGVI